MVLLSRLSNPPDPSERQFLAKYSTTNKSCPPSFWLYVLAINSWPWLIMRLNYMLIICQDGVGQTPDTYFWGWVCIAQMCLHRSMSTENLFSIACGSWRKWEAWLHFRRPPVISLYGLAVLTLLVYLQCCIWHALSLKLSGCSPFVLLASSEYFISQYFPVPLEVIGNPSEQLLSLVISSSSSAESSGARLPLLKSSRGIPSPSLEIQRPDQGTDGFAFFWLLAISPI